jgi:GNAT superfamily N-acetyltransferase
MRGQLDPQKNPLLDHCEYQLFLLEEEGKTIGRIAAFIDTLAVEYWGEKIGLFGYYESPDDLQASSLILDSAHDWLVQKGMIAMRGPWSFVSQEWGAVVEGFEPPPVVMSPYNPPFYNDHFGHYGLQKIKDLLVYYVDAREGYQIPERIMTLTDIVAERYSIRVRPLDLKNYEQEVQTVINLSNDSLAINWGYSPVTEAEVNAMARDLKPVLQSKAVMFAIAIPDINQLIRGLNGRLFPVGIFRLLFGLPRLSQYRMFALGVIPEYHGKGIDSLIYRAMYESCYSPEVRMEINYILEDNYPMNNAVLKLGAKPLRRYRVYQKSI